MAKKTAESDKDKSLAEDQASEGSETLEETGVNFFEQEEVSPPESDYGEAFEPEPEIPLESDYGEALDTEPEIPPESDYGEALDAEPEIPPESDYGGDLDTEPEIPPEPEYGGDLDTGPEIPPEPEGDLDTEPEIPPEPEYGAALDTEPEIPPESEYGAALEPEEPGTGFETEPAFEVPPETELPHSWEQDVESQPEVSCRLELPRKTWGKYFWGLDVGSHSIKLVGLQKKLKKLRLIHVCIVQISPQKELHNRPEDEEVLSTSIMKVLEGLELERNSMISAMDSSSVVVRQIQYPVGARQKLLSALHWEVRKFIPFKPDEVAVDAQILDEEGTDGKMEVLLTAVPKDQLDNHLKLLDLAGVKPLKVDAGQLAVVNTFLEHDELKEEETVVLLDMGARASYLTIYSAVGPFFTLALSVGGSRFTREIQSRCQLAYAEAESLKCKGEQLRDQQFDSDTYYPLHEALQNTYELILSEIRQALVYYNKQTGINKFDRLILTGGGSGLPEFPEYLSRKLGVQVEILDPLKNFEVESEVFDTDQLRKLTSQLTIAVGLAMRGAEG